MASSSSSSNTLVFVFLTCLLLFPFAHNFVAGESDKVKLNLYYESLCPYSRDFIVNGLVKIFDSDLYKIVNLKLVPFGNAKVSDNLTVTCQHGEEECKLNSIEACAIRIWPKQKLHFSFIRCVENNTKNWESCAKNPKSEKAISDCYNSNLSKKLIIGYAKETMSLNPKKAYVPWVTVNGKPLYESYDEFVPQVCKAYKGKTTLPKLCSSFVSSKRASSLVCLRSYKLIM